MTNYHVIEDAIQVFAQLRDGEELEVSGYLAVDPRCDLAILQLAEPPPDLKTIYINAAAQVVQGEEVMAIGHPFGFKDTLTTGVVSDIRTTSELPEPAQRMLRAPSNQRWIQTSAAISGGNSGGPLLNSKGELIGVNSWVAQGENLAFAVHLDSVLQLIDEILIDQEPTPFPVQKQPAEKSESKRIKGPASFTLGFVLNGRANADNKAAIGALQQTIDEYGDIQLQGTSLGQAAESLKYSIQHLSVGSPAGVIDGADQQGQ